MDTDGVAAVIADGVGPAAALVAELDSQLRAAAVPGRAEQERRYLKSSLEHYGTPMPAIRALARQFRRSGELSREEFVAVILLLWFGLAEPVHERRVLGGVLLEGRAGLLTPDDMPLLERLLRESRTWALVDLLACGVAGPLLDSGPRDGVARRSGPVLTVAAATAVLDRWATDPDFWIRRSALLAHERALRAGAGDFPRFTRYADAMLDEREFFIRKAIGWVLRSTSVRRPELVFAWALPRAARMSGVTFRELIRHLPGEDVAVLQAARAR